MIEFYIVYIDCENRRNKTRYLYPSLKSLIENTTTPIFIKIHWYETLNTKYHITVLIYDELYENIFIKHKFENFNTYCQKITKIEKIHTLSILK